MKKVNIKNKYLFDLDDAPLLDENKDKIYMYRLISNVLQGQTKGDAVKFFELARRFYKNVSFELDDSDIDLVIKAIDESQMTALAKAQILSVLKNCAEAKGNGKG